MTLKTLKKKRGLKIPAFFYFFAPLSSIDTIE